MSTASEFETVRQDVDRRIRAIAGQMARLRKDYSLTQILIERSQRQLAASRELLRSAEPETPSARAAVNKLRADAMNKAEQHVKDAELHVARQKALLEQLRAKGQDDRSAARLLKILKSALALYKAELTALK